jgi:hypothetical protein
MKSKIDIRKENEILAKQVYDRLFEQDHQPLNVEQFFNRAFELNGIYQRATLETMFRRWSNEGYIQCAHYKEKPTPFLFPQREYYPIDAEVPIEKRDWLTREEKMQRYIQFVNKMRNIGSTISDKKAWISFIGSFPTEEQNLSFFSKIGEEAYKVFKRPFTTEELTIYITGTREENEIYETVLSGVRRAKSKGYFQKVYILKEIHNRNYIVPLGVNKKQSSNVDWITEPEKRILDLKKMEREKVERENSQHKESKVYQALLDDKYYDIYLLSKLNRITWVPKKVLIELKLEDLDFETNSIHMEFKEGNKTTTSTIILDETTMFVLRLWLEKRSKYNTSKSPFLFITTQSEKVEQPALMMQKFRQYAKEHRYTLGIDYKDSAGMGGHSFLYASKNKHIELSKQMKALNVNWFPKIEKSFLKKVTKELP